MRRLLGIVGSLALWLHIHQKLREERRRQR
jgi:hypothetical protein